MPQTQIFLLTSILFSLFLACSVGDKNAGGSTEVENAVAITNKTIVGVSQKGPFINGSTVTLYELNFETQAQTGKSFIGQIEDDHGSFSISKIELTSQYALLNANGFYRNEISGNISASPIRLNAISDLSDRKNVNINLLTHLEYERAVWLTQTEDMTVKADKKQAGQEIFKAFYADYDNENLEDLDLFGTEEGDEILLAISIIMQVGRSEGEFSLALSDLANDIEKDGVWNDSTQKANFADNAFRANLSDIRFNIEKWGISDKVADFEQHIHSFWSNIFGLGVCDDKRQGEITTNTNPYSDFYENKFVCENEVWSLYDENTPPPSSNVNVDLLHNLDLEDCFNKTIAYDSIKDYRNGNVYKTVKIGEQIWMAENLRYAGENADETTIANLTDNISCYSGDESYCAEKAGYMYTWTAAMNISPTYQTDVSDYPSAPNHRGLCPEGFHVPTLDEWNELIRYAEENGNGDSAAVSLRSTKTWEPSNTAPLGTDLFGFSAVATGALYGYNGYSEVEGQNTMFWTATPIESYDYAWGMNIYHWEITVDDGSRGKSWPTGYLRCVKD